MTGPIERLRSAPRKNRAGGWRAMVIGLALVLLAGWWVTRSSIFAARSITVEGNRHLTRAQVLELAGVDAHTNLVWFLPGTVADRLRRSPWVREADVDRVLPSTLTISVRERTAVAVVSGDRRLLVSDDRTVLGVAPADLDLPEIEADVGAARIGGLLPEPNPGLQVVVAMPETLRIRLDRVFTNEQDVLMVRLDGDVLAIYGDASQARAKAQAVAALLRYAARHQIEAHRLDVRAPGHPALLPGRGDRVEL